MFLDLDLYLVPKSHPNTKNRWAEWRLSFSMVEITLMKQLPFVHRKVYLCCKTLLKKMNIKTIESYVLKTVMLWRMDKYSQDMLNCGEEKLYEFVYGLFHELLEGYQRRNIRNYFLPNVNLLLKSSAEELDFIYQKLKGYVENLSNFVLTSFQDIIHCKYIPCFKFKFRGLIEICKNVELDDKTRCAVIVRECYHYIISDLYLGITKGWDNIVPTVIHRTLQHMYIMKTFSSTNCPDYNNVSVDDLWKICQSLSDFITFLIDKLPWNIERFPFRDSFEELKQNPYCQELQKLLKCNYSCISKSDIKQLWISGGLGKNIEDFRNQTSEVKSGVEDNIAFWDNTVTFQQHFDDFDTKQKIVEDSIKHEVWQYDKIFTNLVSMINKHAPLSPNDISGKYRERSREMRLQQVQIEMFNFGLTNEKFGITTPAKYLLFLIQHIFNNVKMYHKHNGTTDFEEQFWAFFIPDENNELQVFNRKHNTLATC